MRPPCKTPLRAARLRRQSGAAALAVTLLLFMIVAMVLAFANRHLLFEQRSATNQIRATVALEAAQAGLDWAQSLLNSPELLGPDCQPNPGPGSQTFRDQQLRYDAATQLQRSVPLLTAACLHDGRTWRCQCPASGAASVALPAADAPLPGFVVQLREVGQAGQVALHSKGCNQAGPRCWDLAQTADALEATATLRVRLALVGGLHTPPAGALTALGAVHGVSLGAHNSSSGGSGLTIHSGGVIDVASPRLTTVAGAGTVTHSSASLAPFDADLAALKPTELFAAIWGLSPALWAEQSSVTQVHCVGDCGAALQAAIAQRGNRMVQVTGDATLSGPIVIGSAAAPLLLIVTGQLSLLGPVQIHGALFAQALHWHNAPSGGFLRGAAWSSSEVQSNMAPDFFYDAAVLNRLRWNMGSWVTVPGSWSDQ